MPESAAKDVETTEIAAPRALPGLCVVAMPIGAVGDLAPRAREALTAADFVLVEDTRRAGLLFQRLGLTVKAMKSFFEHNEAARLEPTLAALAGGASVALISDAGAPLLSDPGYKLVRACRKAGIPVKPLPGPSAPVTALMAAGLPPYPFTFLGFLPRKASEKKKALAPYAGIKTTLVFFERANRLRETLAQAREVLGDREACLCRELTKTHEEFILGRLESLAAGGEECKGELTIVVGPPEMLEATPEEVVLALFAAERNKGGSPRDIARRVKEQVEGWSADQIYQRQSKARKEPTDPA